MACSEMQGGSRGVTGVPRRESYGLIGGCIPVGVGGAIRGGQDGEILNSVVITEPHR